MGWVGVNVTDYDLAAWSPIIRRAGELELEVVPWGRCWNVDGLERLLRIASTAGWRAIANLEKELEGELPAEVASGVIRKYPELEIAISTEGWLYDSVNWRALSPWYPVLLQLFPSDMRRDPEELPEIQADAVARARSFGFAYVGVTYQTYHEADPDWYSYWTGVRSYYTGDDIGDRWAEWAVAV